jgi:hypothetical protein
MPEQKLQGLVDTILPPPPTATDRVTKWLRDNDMARYTTGLIAAFKKSGFPEVCCTVLLLSRRSMPDASDA